MVRHMPRASVVIPIYQRADMLAPCLAALDAAGLGDIELVLVDNGSTDPAMAPLLDAWEGSAVIRRNPVNAGFAAACNQGARAASAPVVVFLNSDTEVRAGWLEPLLDAVADPGVGMAGSRLLYPDGRIQHAGMALAAGCQPVHLHRGVPGDHPVVTRSRDLLLLTGACCAISRDLFLETGGFDLTFVNGHEDVDLCLRLAASGLRSVYRGDSVVVHHESMSPGRMDRDNENAQVFRRRWHGWAPDWLDLLGEDGIADAGWCDCRWEGPLFDASPEAAFGREAVRALVEDGRRPSASDLQPGPLADDAAALCDDVLLTALNRLRVGAPAAETFHHLRDGRPLGTVRGEGALIAVAGPGAVAAADMARAHMAMAAGPQALEMVQAAGMRPSKIAALDPRASAPRGRAPRRAGRAVAPRGHRLDGPPPRAQRLRGRRPRGDAGRRGRRAPDARPGGRRPRAGAGGSRPSRSRHRTSPRSWSWRTTRRCCPTGAGLWAEVGASLALPVVGATCFETEGLPPSWVAECNAAREVWVPSAFNVRTFSDAGVDPDLLHAVPYPVDTERLRPVPRERDPGAPVTFLSVFEWTWRKGWDVLLRAWAEEFAHDEPVRLVVVTYRGAGAGGAGQRARPGPRPPPRGGLRPGRGRRHRPACSSRSPTRTCPTSTARPTPSCCRPAARGRGCRCSRRPRAACR